MSNHRRGFYGRLLCGAAVVSLMTAGAARAEEQATTFNIAPQPLSSALNEFATQSKTAVLFTPELTGKTLSPGLTQVADAETALRRMLVGTDLTYRRNGDTFIIMRADDPQGGSAAAGGAEVEALIVTAQKREEDIQDVPIAMSAFTQEQLERSQIAGGPDLMTQVPNMTFTKTNFTGYSIQIRGIGTQAISATTDAAVAVAFNNTPFIRNRFFEQEFYDLQRVEVLRGPQGTLYGRNATAGVVNLISQKPIFGYEAKLSADLANYNSTRLEGMINVPLAEDKVALRLAGAWTKRVGYSTNEITGNPIDGRDLWSTRLSLRVAPTDAIDINLIWEHFEEDDDRLRSGKQLCHTDEITSVAGFPTGHYDTLLEVGQALLFAGVQGTFSQGCAPASLYSPESFETPNGLSLPYYSALSGVTLPTALDDPYVSRTQSHDLRTIESTVDPEYRAKSDIFELQFSADLSDELTLSSETAYGRDAIFSMQDYNRFNTASGAWRQPEDAAFLRPGVLQNGPNGGIFCDPQIGCADRLVAVDLSTAKSTHFSQEFRLASDFEGPLNLSLGANFLRYDTEDKYYVFVNSLSLYAASPIGSTHESPYVAGVSDNRDCLLRGMLSPDPFQTYNLSNCIYMDPNPIGSLNDLGHNYFLSRNPYKLISYAVFGEAYYEISDTLKVTGGLRWTVDKKEAPRIPSWLLSAQNVGSSPMELIEQEWREPTGRLAVDWKPHLDYTDETLIYASYAHGYKAGGANPPPAGITCYGVCGANAAALLDASATRPRAFDPEFVDAFEIGSKNTLYDGRLTMNLAAFYYDYEGYQISQIVDRSANNLNFDANIWGLELEADWRPAENLRLGLKLGYEDTSVADGERAIDLMDRTGGNSDWVVVRPFPTFPSNCVLPTWLFLGTGDFGAHPNLVNVGQRGGAGMGGCELAYVMGKDPATLADFVAFPSPPYFRTGVDYAAWSTDPADYPCLPSGADLTTLTQYPGADPKCLAALSNNGQGFFKNLGGNELPNAPNYTATLTADYAIPLPLEWMVNLRADAYYQSESWARIYNVEGYDRLKAYSNLNLAAIFRNDDAGWTVMAYVKNVLDRDSITGAFLNSDDTGLTTNVFLNEPRLYGLRVTKEWTGRGWWTGASAGRDPRQPYPIEVELGGQGQRHDAPHALLRSAFDDEFSPALKPLAAQGRDLDWGDGRSVRLVFKPNGSTFNLSASFRTGEANNDTTRVHTEEVAGPVRCSFPVSFPQSAQCVPGHPLYTDSVRQQIVWSDSEARGAEKHQVVDFAVGRDFGIGGASAFSSALAVGLRHAQLEASRTAALNGTDDLQIPDGWFIFNSQFDEFKAKLSAQSEFRGAGPTLTWEAAQQLLGSSDAGRLKLDWSVTGGVLFGKQRRVVDGEETSGEFNDKYFRPHTLTNVQTTPIRIRRDESATVPVLDLSLGLSYEISRMKIGAGYRWERYFDVLDAGYDEHQDADRTIDGPYFKIAIGFGG